MKISLFEDETTNDHPTERNIKKALELSNRSKQLTLYHSRENRDLNLKIHHKNP